MDKPLILIVEDNAVLQRVIQLLADKCGVEADVVGNGQDAINAINSGRAYRLVFMDWRMPDMDGLECTRIIRQEEASREGAHIPIVAMTAYVGDKDRQLCLASGMDDYMGKPFSHEDFRSVLNRWLTPAQGTRAS